MSRRLTKVPADPDEASQLVSSLRSIPENKLCFDCNKRVPSWCSVTNGVFLCMDCCSRHRGMGVHISFMRSADLDDWQPAQAVSMALGGNARAREYFRQHGITDPKNAYSLPAVVQYRRILEREVQAVMTQKTSISTGEGGGVQSLRSAAFPSRLAGGGEIGSASSTVSTTALDRSLASRSSSFPPTVSVSSGVGSSSPPPVASSSESTSIATNGGLPSPMVIPIPLSSNDAQQTKGNSGVPGGRPKKKGLGGALRLTEGHAQAKE